MGRRIGGRQHHHRRRLQRTPQFGELDAGRLHTTHVTQLVLRNAGGDTQTGRIEDCRQWPPRRRHFALLGMTLGNDARDRRRHRGMIQPHPGLRCRSTRRIVVGTRLVESGLADEILCAQAFCPLVVRLRRGQLRARGLCCLSYLTGVDAHQQFTLPDSLPGIDLHFNNAARNLRGDGRLLHRLDHGIGGKTNGDGVRRDNNVRQRVGASHARQCQHQHRGEANDRRH